MSYAGWSVPGVCTRKITVMCCDKLYRYNWILIGQGYPPGGCKSSVVMTQTCKKKKQIAHFGRTLPNLLRWSHWNQTPQDSYQKKRASPLSSGLITTTNPESVSVMHWVVFSDERTRARMVAMVVRWKLNRWWIRWQRKSKSWISLKLE